MWVRQALEQCVLFWLGEKGELKLEETPKLTRGKEGVPFLETARRVWHS